MKMNQAQENLAISVSSSKKNDEVENLHQKMMEMEVDHVEQINNHMKKTVQAQRPEQMAAIAANT